MCFSSLSAFSIMLLTSLCMSSSRGWGLCFCSIVLTFSLAVVVMSFLPVFSHVS